MRILYQCEACQCAHKIRSWIFHCWDCGKEVCEDCMYSYATCKDCAKSKTDDELKERFDEKHG